MYRGVFVNLSDRLQEVFKMMGEGLTTQQICERTGLRHKAVYRRQYRLRQHFGVENNEELLNIIHIVYEDKTTQPLLRQESG